MVFKWFKKLPNTVKSTLIIGLGATFFTLMISGIRDWLPDWLSGTTAFLIGFGGVALLSALGWYSLGKRR